MNKLIIIIPLLLILSCVSKVRVHGEDDNPYLVVKNTAHHVGDTCTIYLYSVALETEITLNNDYEGIAPGDRLYIRAGFMEDWNRRK